MVGPTGEQFEISAGGYRAVVTEGGATLRLLEHDGRAVVDGFAEDAMPAVGRGQLLMPWPNRIRDGRYSVAGQSRQLALSEPERGNAIHGLVRWAIWSVLAPARADQITLVCRLRPQQGWAWSLDLAVTYALTDEGLTVTPHAVNVGTGAAPFGFGAHPYLSVGEERVDEVRLGIPARSLLEVDDRLLPRGIVAVDGTDRDFREPRLLGETTLDTAFTNVVADVDGRWRVTLAHPGTGRAVTVWADATAYPWLQVFTGGPGSPTARRSGGIAVEPMTCAPDAFNSGDGLLSLEPGQEFAASWGVIPG